MYRHWIRAITAIGVLSIGYANASVGTDEQWRIEKLDPGLDAILSTQTTIEKIAGGYRFTEGPVWSRAGYLYFSDIPSAVIHRRAQNGSDSVWMGPREFTASGPAGGSPGPNGLAFDQRGRLTICDQGNRRIVRLEHNGHLTVLADHYNGKRLNSPNDLVYKSDGALYFTDPPFGLSNGDGDIRKEQPVNGVYRLLRGKLDLLISDLPRPNGIAFSPDEKYLYVSNTGPQKVYLRYKVNSDGTLGDREVLCDMTDSRGLGVPDGMKVDQRGNIYGSGPGGIWIIAPSGKHLGTIHLPEVAANCAWGEADSQTLYITATSAVYKVKLRVRGARSF